MKDTEKSKNQKPAPIQIQGKPEKGIHLSARAIILIGIVGTLLTGLAFHGIASRGEVQEKLEGSKAPENLSPAVEEGKEMAQHAAAQIEAQRKTNTDPSGMNDTQNSAGMNSAEQAPNPNDELLKRIHQQRFDEHAKALNASSRVQGGWGSFSNETDKAPIGKEQPSSDFNKSIQSLNEASKRLSQKNGSASDPSKKSDFLTEAQNNPSEVLPFTRRASISPFELKAGTIIPATLITGISSDLPGDIIAQVKEDIYDTVTGRHLLLPKGARVYGKYSNQISYGQDRVDSVWNRFIFPDGSSLNIGDMRGSDQGGYSGFKDRVDNHYGKLITGALLTSALAVGLQLSQPQNQNSNVITTQQLAAASVGQQLTALGMKVAEKNLNIQPTIEIGNGYEFTIKVSKDMVFEAPYSPYQN